MIKKTSLYILFLILLAQYGYLPLFAQSYTIETIFTPNTELVPGTGLKGNLSLPDSFSINNNGEIVAHAFLSDGTWGIIHYTNGNLKLLERKAVQPSLNESKFILFGISDINDNGDVILCGNLAGKDGIYKISENNVIPLMVIGDSVTSTGNTIKEFGCISPGPSVNNNEEITFNATLSDDRHGLFLFKEEDIEPILLEGDMFPVFNGDEIIIFTDQPMINDNGEIVFRARFSAEKTNDLTDERGIFLFSDEEFIPIKLRDQKVPGTNGNVFSSRQDNRAVLSNNTEIIYFSNYRNLEDETASNSTIEFGQFLWSSGETIPKILPGDIAPGTNGFFVDQDSLLAVDAINDFGDIASVLLYKEVAGIFLRSKNELIPVLLSNFPPPNFNENFIPISCGINNQGDIVFSAEFGSPQTRRRGLFVAIKEDAPFNVNALEPAISAKKSILRIEVTGTGFQPGAVVSFSNNEIRATKTDFKTSNTLVATVNVISNVEPGSYDVIVTNPTGKTVMLENGFKVVK